MEIYLNSINKIPIFVRGGGIVPTEVKDILTLNVFPCGNSSFKLYEDDGISSIDEEANEYLSIFSKLEPNEKLTFFNDLHFENE